MKPGHGRADYLLYVDQRGRRRDRGQAGGHAAVRRRVAVGDVRRRACPRTSASQALTTDGRLPFVFEASGTETHFTNGYDPDPRARRIFNFPKPDDPRPDPARRRGRPGPPDLARQGPRPAAARRPRRCGRRRSTAINGVERSLAEQRFDRTLVQMATGAGKTYTAVTESYRLLKHGGFNRILFLVDRNNLADQTLAEFQNYRTPDDGRRFTELYNVDKLTSAGMLGSLQAS